MKILFLFTGMLRTFDFNIYQNIKGYDCDFYVLNTNDTKDKYSTFKGDVSNKIKVIHAKPFQFKNQFDEKTLNTLKQWYNLHTLFNSIQSIKDYDLFIRIRPDIYFNDDVTKLFKLDPTKFNIPSSNDIYSSKVIDENPGLSFINDQMCITNYENMKYYSDMYTFIQSNQSDKYISENLLADYLKGKPIVRFNFDYTIRLSKCNVISICGDSGVGKSTMLSEIRKLFDNSVCVETDRYHKWDRGNENWKKYTHLNPNANYLEKLQSDAFNLSLGNKVITVDYDHKTGKFIDNVSIIPKDNLVLCGLHTMYESKLRDIIDVSIYIDAETRLKTQWKINRDCKLRGYSLEKVMENIEKRKQDFTYISSQRQYTDIRVYYYSNVSDVSNTFDLSEPKDIKMKISISDTFYNKHKDKLSNVTFEKVDESGEYTFKSTTDDVDSILKKYNQTCIDNIKIVKYILLLCFFNDFFIYKS